MIPDERRAKLAEAGRKGGKARAALPDFLEHQSRAGKASAAVNDMAALGHRGAVAYARKYGYARLFHLCRRYRLDHPSEPERAVVAILAGMGLQEGQDYEREAMPLGEGAFIAVDFALAGQRKVIEVNGKVHYDPAFDHPSAPGTRAANEARRLERLQKAGWSVLVLDYRDLACDGETARQQVINFVET
jgi:very-short-patch-repair endonuclease